MTRPLRSTLRCSILLAFTALAGGCPADLHEVGESQHELIGASSIHSGRRFSCALMPSGEPICWGGVVAPPPGPFVAFDAGADHWCALDAGGSVTCGGSANLYGETNAPLTAMSDVAAGQEFSCGVRTADGAVECWGRNDYGQATPPFGAYDRVEAGAFHACARRADSSKALDCWGYNPDGRAAGTNAQVIDFSTGGYHTCYVRDDGNGTILCFGNSRMTSAPFGSFMQVSAGLVHTCAIRASDNKAQCWGSNGWGQQNIPQIALYDLSAGYYHGCYIRQPFSDVACVGSNTFGQSTPPP